MEEDIQSDLKPDENEVSKIIDPFDMLLQNESHKRTKSLISLHARTQSNVSLSDLDSVGSNFSSMSQIPKPTWRERSQSLFRYRRSYSVSHNSVNVSNRSFNEKLPSISFDSTYDENMRLRANSILHINRAVTKKVFIRNGLRISRHSILLGNGMAYLPDITIRHDKTGSVLHAHQLQKRYGMYNIDPYAPAVLIHMQLKSVISESLSFEDKDYQLALKIQSDLNNQRNNEHVVKLYHVLETPANIISITEIVIGTIEEFGDWIRNEHLVQNVFCQIVDGYSRLLQIGYCHCNLCSETILVQFKANSEKSSIPTVIIKLTGFEQAVNIVTTNMVTIEDGNMKGETSYMAPECFDGCYDATKADLWSLGIILYDLLSGETPFDIANDSDPIFLNFEEEGFDSFEDFLVSCNIDRIAIDLIRRLLVVHPGDRLRFDEILNHPYIH